jgi:hypothetical protein
VNGAPISFNTMTRTATVDYANAAVVDYFGTDTFNYTVTDAGGETGAPVTVTLTVTPVDDGPPVLTDKTINTSDSVPGSADLVVGNTIRDRPPFTITITQPANGTATLNLDNTVTYVSDPNYSGTDLFTYTVTDFDGQTATANVNVNVAPIPPTITSPLMVNAISTLNFSYTITAAGTAPFTFTASPLPPGASFDGTTITGFIPAGSYTVTLTATNLSGTDTKTLVITSTDVIPGVDTDGDGYSDELEIGVGSDPTDPFSTPFTVLKTAAGFPPNNAPAPGPGTPPSAAFYLVGSGLSVNLNFKTPGRDQILLKGTLPVPAGVNLQAQPAAVSVGGVVWSGTLDLRGGFTSLDRSASIKLRLPKSALVGANVSIQAKRKGGLASMLSDEGLQNTTVLARSVDVPVTIIAGPLLFQTSVPSSYTARQDVKGTSRLR